MATPYPSDAPATGGNSLDVNLNQYYSGADLAWIMASSALVLIMVPGVAFFYSGLARRKSALSLIHLGLLSLGVVTFEWFFWGYSLTFSHSASAYIGDLTMIGFKDVLGAPSSGAAGLPDILYAVYQLMFAAITPAIAIGAAAERGRILPCMVFIFVWSTIVYNPIACWTWNPSGWLFKLGSLDFAGGSPVHLSSGTAALAYSYMLGKRREHGAREIAYRPHNVTHVVLGTVFLWFGWQGFNGGSALGANLRACMALFVTNLAAAVGGLTWMLLDYRLERKWSTVGFCSGAISGLVAITPASGYVPPWSAVVFGIVGGIACNLATKLKYVMRVDDAMDIFAVHGIGAMAGNLMTGLFAKKSIAALDGATVISGGWLDRNWIQLAYQLADTVTVFAYSFAVTCAILAIMNFIPGLSLRASEDAERLGMDEAEIGEFAYDYVERARDHAHVVVMEGQHVSSSNSMSEKVGDKESARAVI